MRWLSLVPLMTAMGAGATLLAGAAPRAERPRYLLTDREGFVLREAELVAAPLVTAAVWSPDGRYLLAVRQEKLSPPLTEPAPSGALSLITWNRGTGRSRVMWQRPAGAQMISQIEWLPGTHAALIVLNWLASPPPQPEPRKTLLWIDAAHGQTRVLGDLQTEQLLVSPTQPQAVLYRTEPDGQEQPSLRVVRADGSIGPAVPLPRKFNIDRWAPDGNALYGVVWEGPGTREQPAHPMWHLFDPRTGALTALASVPEMPQEKPMPVRLRSTVTPLKEENTTQKVFPLWLESTVKSEHPRALVGADCDGGSLAPDASAVLYLSQGAAWVALLTRLPRERMLAQLRAAQRQEAVSKARQIATGLMMYVQDYDETYPPPGDAVINQIRPYVRDSDVFVAPGENEPGFVYLFSARTTNSIKNPATQELGYLPGPGGRAMIYADGHVEWRSDNQSPGEPAGEARRRGYFR